MSRNDSVLYSLEQKEEFPLEEMRPTPQPQRQPAACAQPAKAGFPAVLP